jgi:hypothetical protein
MFCRNLKIEPNISVFQLVYLEIIELNIFNRPNVLIILQIHSCTHSRFV